VFGRRVLRKAYGPKREKVKRDWRKQDEEELPVSHSSTVDQIKVGGECDTCGGEGKCVQCINGKHEGKRPLERPKHKCIYSALR
jgi:RecJ-like exonuclease